MPAQNNPLGTQSIPHLLGRFAIPSVIAMLVTALYNIVDQIFIGQGIGLLGNAATNVALPLTTICIAAALLLGTGSAANYSLSLGAKKTEHAAQIAGTAITLMVASGVIICVIVRLFLQPLLQLFGTTSEVLPYAATYTSITSFGIPFIILSSGMSNLIRADGSPHYSMACMLIGALINTILDPLFIFVFHWGIGGAALATIIGQIVSGLAALFYITRFRNIQLTAACLRPRGALALSIASLGMSGCFNQLAMMLVQITLNNTLTRYGANSPYGAEIPLAVAGIIIKVNMLCMSFVIGISQASQPIVGFNYGAKQYARVRKTYLYAAGAATVVSLIAFAAFQLFPQQIISIFGQGDQTYFLFAKRFFRIFMFCTCINGIQPVTANFFSSIGKPVRGLLLSLTRQIIFLLPLVICLPMAFGIDGVVYAGPIADTAAFIVAIVMVSYEFRHTLSAGLTRQGEGGTSGG